jgi:hypothetical protein
MPQSPMFTPTVFVHRYFTESCKIFTAYAIITDEKSIGDLPGEIQTELVRRYISSGNFFGAFFPSVRPSVFFFFIDRSSDRNENYRLSIFRQMFSIGNVVGKIYTDR